MTNIPSCWNAYVESGKDIQERRARLAEVPDEWRESVRAHVATVFALKEAARLREKAKTQNSKGRPNARY
jgi:hypothetical protein